MPQLKIKDNGVWVDIPAGGVGVPSGGTTGQILKKSSSVDYATQWASIGDLLVTDSVSIDNVSVSSGSTYTNDFNIAKTGYIPIAIAGINIENASSSGLNANGMAIYRFCLDAENNVARFGAVNRYSSAANIKITIFVLYIIA